MWLGFDVKSVGWVFRVQMNLPFIHCVLRDLVQISERISLNVVATLEGCTHNDEKASSKRGSDSEGKWRYVVFAEFTKAATVLLGGFSFDMVVPFVCDWWSL